MGLGEEEGPDYVSLPVSYCGCCRAGRCRADSRAGPAGVRGSGGQRRCQQPRLEVGCCVRLSGGGYPVPPGQLFPNPGTCRAGTLDSNHSESWIAVKPGTEDLVGNSKFFFENFSKFYDFYLGSYDIINGTPAGDNQVQGYDCVSNATQAMPPSWTDVTDPNVAFDTN